MVGQFDAEPQGCQHPASLRAGARAFRQTTCGLVYLGKVHAIGILQPGNLARVVLHFQIRRHDRNVDRLALGGVGAFGANAVKFQIPVMG